MTTITIDRELLEQALVALSAPNHCVFSEPPICVDIRAALAAPATAPTQPAFESWCASMGFIPTQARYETWQAATAAAINKICADVQAAGFANGGIETPADVAPEILFQLKEKIEAATAAALAAPATAPAQPAWHDAPTVPGVWICDEGDICYTWTAHNIEILDQFDPGDGLRWYGPIPPDGDKP